LIRDRARYGEHDPFDGEHEALIGNHDATEGNDAEAVAEAQAAGLLSPEPSDGDEDEAFHCHDPLGPYGGLVHDPSEEEIQARARLVAECLADVLLRRHLARLEAEGKDEGDESSFMQGQSQQPEKKRKKDEEMKAEKTNPADRNLATSSSDRPTAEQSQLIQSQLAPWSYDEGQCSGQSLQGLTMQEALDLPMVSGSSTGQVTPSATGHWTYDAGQCSATGSSSGGPPNPSQRVQYGPNRELLTPRGEGFEILIIALSLSRQKATLRWTRTRSQITHLSCRPG